MSQSRRRLTDEDLRRIVVEEAARVAIMDDRSESKDEDDVDEEVESDLEEIEEARRQKSVGITLGFPGFGFASNVVGQGAGGLSQKFTRTLAFAGPGFAKR